MALALGRRKQAQIFEQEAEQLRQRFERAFWCEEISTYALALDGKSSPARFALPTLDIAFSVGSPARNTLNLWRGLFLTPILFRLGNPHLERRGTSL